MRTRFQILDKWVGLSQSPYFIAAIGPEQPGAGEAALVAAGQAGADAICPQGMDALSKARQRELAAQAQTLNLALIPHVTSRQAFKGPMAEAAAAFHLTYPETLDPTLMAMAAATGKPLLVSTEAMELDELESLVKASAEEHSGPMALLHYVGGDEQALTDSHLHTILDMSFRFDTAVGLKDLATGTARTIAAVALGATIVWRPLAVDPDGAASFSSMLQDCRAAWQSLGRIHYALSDEEVARRKQPKSA